MADPHLADDLSDDRLTTVGLLLEVHSALIQKLAQVHHAHGLLGKEFDTLLRLARSPGRSLRMSELAGQTGTSTSGITGVIDRLEDRGLVRRTASRTDRRSLVVTLTDEGNQLVVDDVRDLVPLIQDTVIGPLGRSRRTFENALRALRGAGMEGGASR